MNQIGVLSPIDLSSVSTDDLLAEVARRCGTARRRQPVTGSLRGAVKKRTKQEWALAMAEEARHRYHDTTDPSVRAREIQEIGKFEKLAALYKMRGE